MANIYDRIQQLKEKRNAIILAHNYQIPEIQDIADFVGDSLGLSRQAAQTDAKVIVFCGVDFMAETAAMLSPDKKVLLPAIAGCPLAETVDVDSLRQKKAAHPKATVVCYINSSAAVKAESDICCTSSNAVKIVNSIDAQEIIFIPDGNLGHWVAEQTGRDLILWEGFCVTHHRVLPEEVHRVRRLHPDGEILVHPECRPQVVALADQALSTDGMLQYIKTSPGKKFIMGTEMGILHRCQKENPDKTFYLLSPGLVCPNMKRISSLSMVEKVLMDLSNQVTVPEDIRKRALASVEKMLAIN